MCAGYPYCYFYCWYTCRVDLNSDSHGPDCCFYRWYWQNKVNAVKEWEEIRSQVMRDYGIQEDEED